MFKTKICLGLKSACSTVYIRCFFEGTYVICFYMKVICFYDLFDYMHYTEDSNDLKEMSKRHKLYMPLVIIEAPGKVHLNALPRTDLWLPCTEYPLWCRSI